MKQQHRDSISKNTKSQQVVCHPQTAICTHNHTFRKLILSLIGISYHQLIVSSCHLQSPHHHILCRCEGNSKPIYETTALNIDPLGTLIVS